MKARDLEKTQNHMVMGSHTGYVRHGVLASEHIYKVFWISQALCNVKSWVSYVTEKIVKSSLTLIIDGGEHDMQE